jgi:hypothetical protein
MSIYLVECKGALLNNRIVSINENDKYKYARVLRMSRHNFDELSHPHSRPINTQLYFGYNRFKRDFNIIKEVFNTTEEEWLSDKNMIAAIVDNFAEELL